MILNRLSPANGRIGPMPDAAFFVTSSDWADRIGITPARSRFLPLNPQASRLSG